MQIDLIAGQHTSPCIAHDAPFEANPLWVKYEAADRQLSIILENGGTRRLTTPINEAIAQQLNGSRKIMLVRLHGGRPIEGFECQLRKFDEVGYEYANA